MGGSLPLAISVLLATRGRPELVGRALVSLAAQTLAAERFEVVVVVNGEDDGTAASVARCTAEHPRLQVRVAHCARPGVAHARSLGLELARGEHMTVVDDDDTVSPHFLEDLLAAVEPGVVPVAWLAETDPSTPDQRDFDNYMSRALERTLARHPGGDVVVDADSLPQAISLNVGKLLPVTTAREVGYDWELRGGSDFVFWTRAFARTHFRLRLLRDRRAHYVRTRSPDSLSRRAPDRDFAVTQRLACIASLEDLETHDPAVASVVHHVVRAQLSHVRGYLAAHPDTRSEVVEQVEELGSSRVDWSVVNRGLAQDLALLYCFPPWVDTAGIVAGRRLRERGIVVDVVCKDLDGLRPRDPSLASAAAPFVADVRAIDGDPDFSSWRSIEAWSDGVFAELAGRKSYRSVYSRAMWVASHLVAAQYRLRNPGTQWLAEFSDPISRTVRGRRRPGGVREGPLLDELRDAVRRAGFEPPTHRNTFVWAESVAYALADEIVFTNAHQRDYMLAGCSDPRLAERARSVSRVSHHPALPTRFYDMRDPHYELVPDTVHLAYFGAFYPTRALTEVTGALGRLDRASRRRIRLHVFTQDPEAVRGELRALDLSDVVVVNPYVDLLDFLALTRRFDLLVVNDADTSEHEGGVNPYLPSKLADYLGSGTPIWAIVEPGSVMSRTPLAHHTPLGDVDAAAAVLKGLVASRFGTAAGARPAAATATARPRRPDRNH